jgi:amidophosphoribosyltransferase
MNLVGIANRLLTGIDGAYVIVAIIGNGCGFVISDPRAIRPACYYVDDEIITAGSESLPITSAFDISGSKIKYLGPGEGLFVKNKTAEITRYTKAKTPRPCQFEYVYFARPNSLIWEQEVKQVRDRLAIPLARIIENEIGVFDDKHVIFSIPHSSLPATIKIAKELDARTGKFLLDMGLTKDDAVRTFISSELERIGMASTKYDPIESVIYGKKCIAVDDSHVRGTTTKEKIIPITFRAGAEELYLAFTCPEIRYTCCYGIDMSSLKELVAFNAAMAVCKEKRLDKLVHKVYLDCLLQKQKLEEEKIGMPKNLVARIYDNLNDQDILRKMVELITPRPELKERIHLIYQSVSGLRNAIGRGTNICDACLTGNYPTKGGITALNQSFIDYVEKREGRGHENL